jgi:TldD protein
MYNRSRREFLLSSAALANSLFGAPNDSKSPSPELEKLGAIALAQAKKQRATYCDIRINRYHNERISFRASPEGDTGKTLEVPAVNQDGSFGFGVRVIADGAWGFAASPVVTPAEIARITAAAIQVARANAILKSKPVMLAPVRAYKDRWVSPFERNPFDVPIGEKLEILRAAAAEVKKEKRVFSASGHLNFSSQDKYFTSSEGSSIQQFIVQSSGSIDATARDVRQALTRSRAHSAPGLSIGWEYVPNMNLSEHARRIREEVLEKLAAPPVEAGKKDLLLLPSHLCLTIHESMGHSTELDRALGYEANYAGTSFLTTDKMGKQRVGSDIVTVYGDRTTPQALSTVAYDDDGVKTTRFPIIEKGIFKHYQTTRDQAHLIGEKESRGCCFADSWSSIPFQRMPNVWLEAGPSDTTLADLISGIDDGILIEGLGSYSIDQQRYNFQFGGDAFWEIKGGKKAGMLSRVAYQSRTPDFWQACDGIAGRSFWQQHGLHNDGKGEPMQVNSMSHGCAPARFRQVNVIQTD